jgi:aspartate/methionine/tyrosine aminotransferase
MMKMNQIFEQIRQSSTVAIADPVLRPKAGQNSITCVAPFVQKAAAFALSDAGVDEDAANMQKTYARRCEMVLQIAREYGESPVRLTPPQCAFYFFWISEL